MKKLAIAVAAALAIPAVAQTYYTPSAPSYNSYNNELYNSNERDHLTWEERQERRELRRELREARNDDRYRGDTARVIDKRPLYAANEAKQECWNPRAGHYEEVRGSGDHSALNKGTALGALVGGVAGHQVDSGTGTAVGAVLGGLAGNYLNRRNDRDEQTDLDRSRCRVVAENGVSPRGYEVRYEHQGREYVTRTTRDPGQFLRLGDDVRHDGTPFDVASR
jgi:uncharacterized protein YcfJ